MNDLELQDLYFTYNPHKWAEMYVEETEGIELDQWQQEFLKDNGKKLLLNCHRQSGKSTAVSIKAVHRAVTRDDQTILLVSTTQRQSSELFYKVRKVVKSTSEYSKMLTTDNIMSLALTNGSRIISLPGTDWNLRGYTADMVIVDEAAGVEDSVFDALSPMLLTTDGTFIMLSTPRGNSGKFYEASISDNWKKYVIRASENPRMQTPEKLQFLREELIIRGSRMYAQEYECEFLDNLDVGRIKRDWWKFYDVSTIPQLLKDSKDIYISWDTASKIKEINDYTAASVWLRIGDDHYFLDLLHEKLLFPDLLKNVIRLDDQFRPVYNIIEDKSSGIALIQDLRRNYPHIPIYEFDPGRMDKSQRVDIAAPTIEAGRVFLPANFVHNGQNTVTLPTENAQKVIDNMAQFPNGEHDDISDSVSMYLVYSKEGGGGGIYFF